MSRHLPLLLAAASALSLSACAADSLGSSGIGVSNYTLVRPQIGKKVGNGDMVVVPPREWNKLYPRFFSDVGAVEDWTLNGVSLDDITFVTGVKDGKYLIRQDRREYRQVPRFKSNMTPQEVVAMLESLYRIGGGAVDWKTLAIEPATFMGGPGFRYDYEHLDGDELWRRGRGYARIIDGRLFLVQLDAARSHYYGAALADLEALAASARAN